eukprot:TRINITY_DN5426_c1_g1_i2.p1 TRINITY_DN5426_c1_g1~~TRINITY_DN5426_c1_g1_i2.p1  ORF type:complete len:508 (-),score=141.62 TRINITY_DN5426_c1_g1_i2:1606-3129(-)
MEDDANGKEEITSDSEEGIEEIKEDHDLNARKCILVFGVNEGDLGLGHWSRQTTPVELPIDDAIDPVYVQTANGMSAFITKDGKLWIWGKCNRFFPEEDVLTKPRHFKPLDHLFITSVSFGSDFMLALTKDGQVYGVGGNAEGQLGNGTTFFAQVPQKILIESKVKSIATGPVHSLCLTVDGEVFSFGNGERGRLGLGNSKSTSTPTKIDFKLKILQISAGKFHSVALGQDQNIYTWGSNEYGLLGIGLSQKSESEIPMKIQSDHFFKYVASGDLHNLALSTTGKMFAWGRGVDGQLGNGLNGKRDAPEHVKRPVNANFTSVICGGLHSGGLTKQGTLFLWGKGNGQLGHVKVCDEWKPKKVSTLNPYYLFQVELGAKNTMCLAVKRETPLEDEVDDVTEESPDDVYEVENIIDSTIIDGVTRYLVKWKGWPSSANTWERKENLLGCSEKVKEFEERNPDAYFLRTEMKEREKRSEKNPILQIRNSKKKTKTQLFRRRRRFRIGTAS